ncbi:MAG TPA: hypothetical protein VEX70_14285 [Pyrinomonadaceae bacterium]|nr:hypothetical protein [Pyrinomonadaceae bacterium]
MTSRWQISAGDITEWLPPLLYAFAVLASAWVLHDARRRRFTLLAVAAWTLATLISAPIVLPLYFIARAFKPHPVEPPDAATETAMPEDPQDAGLEATADGGATLETGAAATLAARGESSSDGDEQVAPQSPPRVRASHRLKRHAPPLLYAFALLSAGAVYFYRDYHSFDAHLVRATKARLLNRRADAIREYRAALSHADDAHTHKLLGIQLAEDGQTKAALAEFRAAERGSDPDELLPYRVASALDALGRAAEASEEYRKFLRGGLCVSSSPDARCAEASARVR